MSSPININRWQNKVRALFGLRGENPVPTLLELHPVTVLENDRPEWSYPGGELLWAGNGSIAAGGAGNFSRMGVENPLNSGVLGIVEGIVIANTQAGRADVVIGVSLSTLLVPTASQTMNPRDGRQVLTAQQSACRLVRKNDTTAAQDQALFLVVPVATTETLFVPWVLVPGTTLWVGQTTANLALGEVGFIGRERPQERGVLS